MTLKISSAKACPMVDRKLTRGPVPLRSAREIAVVALTGLDASPTMKSVAPASRCIVARVARDRNEFARRRAKAGELLS